MKKLLAVAMAATILTTLISGCGSDPKADTGSNSADGEDVVVSPTGEFPITSKPITLTYFAEADMTEEDQGDLPNNEMLKMIREKTNISLELIPLNYSAEGKQKMILSFAAGDYPDGAMLSWNTMLNNTDVIQYGTGEKILLPLNDLIEEYGTELKNIFELRPGHKELITAPDGNIYGIPRFTECGHCMSYPKLWFNYEWLDNLGLEEPQTTEELYNVLKAFKTQDPNGNGIADEIPLTGTIDFSGALEYYLMNSFLDCPAFNNATDPRTFLIWNNDQVEFMATRPEYKEGIEWIKKLYDEGLIDPANFTQNAEALKQQCRTGTEATVGGYTIDHMDMGIEFVNTEISKQYHALPPVAGPNGVRYQPYNSPAAQLAGYNFVLFEGCKYPEAGYRLADWFLSEEMTFNVAWGIEGKAWNKPEDANAKNIIGGPLKCVINRLPATATEQEKKEFKRYSLGVLEPYADLQERRAMWSPEATDETLEKDYETRLEWETQKTTEYWPEVCLPRNVFMSAEDASEYSELKLNISQHVQKNTSMFITGARPLSDWDTYVKELEQFNTGRYVELYAKAYDRIAK